MMNGMTGPGGGRHLYVRGRLGSGQLVSHLLLPAWNVILAGNDFQRRSCPAATSVGKSSILSLSPSSSSSSTSMFLLGGGTDWRAYRWLLVYCNPSKCARLLLEVKCWKTTCGRYNVMRITLTVNISTALVQVVRWGVYHKGARR